MYMCGKHTETDCSLCLAVCLSCLVVFGGQIGSVQLAPKHRMHRGDRAAEATAVVHDGCGLVNS